MNDRHQAALDVVRQYFGAQHPLFLAMRLAIDTMGGGRAEMSMPCTERMCDSRGALHRGAMVTLLDCACGLAVFSALGTVAPVATVDLRVDYLRAVPPGTGIRAIVDCVNANDTMAWIAGRAVTDDADAVLLANVSGTFALNTQGPDLSKFLPTGTGNAA